MAVATSPPTPVRNRCSCPLWLYPIVAISKDVAEKLVVERMHELVDSAIVMAIVMAVVMACYGYIAINHGVSDW